MYQKLIEKLEAQGYKVEKISKENERDIVRVSGKNIYGFIGNKFDGKDYYNNQYLDGAFVFDNANCFDKVRKCPIQLKLPKDNEEINKILKELEYLGSDEGYKLSSEFEYGIQGYIKKYQQLNNKNK